MLRVWSRPCFQPEPETSFLFSLCLLLLHIKSLFSGFAYLCPWQGRNLACSGQQACNGALLALPTPQVDRAWLWGSLAPFPTVVLVRAGCPSVQQCSVEIVSRFLLSSILVEVVSLVTALASDTTVKVFEQIW